MLIGLFTSIFTPPSIRRVHRNYFRGEKEFFANRWAASSFGRLSARPERFYRDQAVCPALSAADSTFPRNDPILPPPPPPQACLSGMERGGGQTEEPDPVLVAAAAVMMMVKVLARRPTNAYIPLTAKMFARIRHHARPAIRHAPSPFPSLRSALGLTYPHRLWSFFPRMHELTREGQAHNRLDQRQKNAL